MTFIWTSPDPLNNTAKTRSVYMTELQVAANIRRVEIAQSQLTFINQNIGQKFVLSAIEELKTVVNQLAIDFGYTDGVENGELLGRPYVTITKKYGKTVCYYPILNDLRVVLNTLIFQDYIIFVQANLDIPITAEKYYITDYYSGSFNIKRKLPLGGSYSWSGGIIITDGAYIYVDTGTGLGLAKIKASDGSIVITKPHPAWWYPYSTLDWVVDKDYIYVLHQGTTVHKWDKNFNEVSSYTIDLSHYQAPPAPGSLGLPVGLAIDKDFLYIYGGVSPYYLTGRSYYEDPPNPGPPPVPPSLYNQEYTDTIICKINKDFTSPIYYRIPPIYGTGKWRAGTTLYPGGAFDSEFLYFYYLETGYDRGWTLYGMGPVNLYGIRRLIKINKTALSIPINLIEWPTDLNNKLVACPTYLYGYKNAAFKAVVLNKSGIIIYENPLDPIDESTFEVASTYQYKVTL